jgi:hypothetical protein
LLVRVDHRRQLTERHAVAHGQGVMIDERGLARVEHGPSDRDGVERVRAIQQDHAQP